jgi:hypothetical protein
MVDNLSRTVTFHAAMLRPTAAGFQHVKRRDEDALLNPYIPTHRQVPFEGPLYSMQTSQQAN